MCLRTVPVSRNTFFLLSGIAVNDIEIMMQKWFVNEGNNNREQIL